MTDSAATDTLAANLADWLRYLERQARTAAKRVEGKVETAERYLVGRTVADLREDDLDNYARALQDLRVARREQADAESVLADARATFTAA